eukprot:scaffold8023_cov103-Isochrysis_galbana.AAC.18
MRHQTRPADDAALRPERFEPERRRLLQAVEGGVQFVRKILLGPAEQQLNRLPEATGGDVLGQQLRQRLASVQPLVQHVQLAQVGARPPAKDLDCGCRQLLESGTGGEGVPQVGYRAGRVLEQLGEQLRDGCELARAGAGTCPPNSDGRVVAVELAVGGRQLEQRERQRGAEQLV